MPAKRRLDDPEADDHIEERQAFLDWRAAPKWVIVSLVGLSMSLNALLGAAVITLVVERFQMVERAQRDPLIQWVRDIDTLQAKQGEKITANEDAIRQIRSETLQELREINQRLRNKGL